MRRAFLALDLPPDVRSALAVLQFLLPLPVQTPPAAIPPDRLHLTLVDLGDDLPDPLLFAVHEGIEALRLPAFDLTLAGAGLFGGARPRVAFAGVAPQPVLDQVQAKVETAARRAGASLPARRFRPHVALARFAPPPPDAALRLERAVVDQAGFRAGPFPVRALVLYESRPHRDGPRHTALADYPLG